MRNRGGFIKPFVADSGVTLAPASTSWTTGLASLSRSLAPIRAGRARRRSRSSSIIASLAEVLLRDIATRKAFP